MFKTIVGIIASVLFSFGFLIAMAVLTLVILSAGYAQGSGVQECNALRRTIGLPPLIEDPQLSAIAQQIAEWQAYYQIRSDRGYSGHEHWPRQPQGYDCGTAASPSGIGWSSCNMEIPGTHRAGAGIAIGADGYRYMALIVPQGNYPGRNGIGLVPTAHMTPNVPRIPYSGVSVPRRPPGSQPTSVYNVYARYPGPRGSVQRRQVLPRQIIPRTKAAPASLSTPVQRVQYCPQCGKYHPVQ